MLLIPHGSDEVVAGRTSSQSWRVAGELGLLSLVSFYLAEAAVSQTTDGTYPRRVRAYDD